MNIPENMIPIILCSGANGRCVQFGWVESFPKPGEAVLLHNARMVLYWPAACGGLLGLAANGPKDGLKLTAAVTKSATTCHDAVEVSKEAAAQLFVWRSV